ncbi:2'-5' RNA ligase family protein [Deinococcus cellulosilyticus]|uniref:2'-5' RNA ligase n=1 Tax=Deinococcus cellulosilyticus (strain DSM 18568 / NBRC 106333 / KACC 11606 / 5516J-15) TaxID=1223518 RepID=A0A511N8K2_DEIC1|nr:2'-5' RNA ligase family protein [Deinococcus cellulosilyticus]GEM48721.1 hypothetical protein DC3_43560 [Deinococcus cellulosilyticus NBRC 106333 = KACC 11606]
MKRLLVKAPAASAAPKGIILCLVPPEDVAHQLALSGGLPEEELHVTLAYLGKTDSVALDQVKEAARPLREYLKGLSALKGEFSGVGRFTIPKKDAFFLTLDVPGLNVVRETCCNVLKMCGLPPDNTHGFTPHMTLKYVEASEPVPVQRLTPVPVEFTHMELWYGSTHLRVPIGR